MQAGRKKKKGRSLADLGPKELEKYYERLKETQNSVMDAVEDRQGIRPFHEKVKEMNLERRANVEVMKVNKRYGVIDGKDDTTPALAKRMLTTSQSVGDISQLSIGSLESSKSGMGSVGTRSSKESDPYTPKI